MRVFEAMRPTSGSLRRFPRAPVYVKVPTYCKGCVWVIPSGNKALCPFARCVRRKGWVADQT